MDKNRLLSLAEHVGNMGHWGWDIATDSLTLSDQVMLILGLERATCPATAAAMLELCHPDDRAEVRGQLDEARARGTGFEFDVRISRPDGAVRTLIFKGQPEFDGARRLIAMFGVATDVTDAFAAIHSLHDRTEMLDLAAELAHLGHWVWSKETGHLSYCSEEMARLHALTPEEFLARYRRPDQLAAAVSAEHRENYCALVSAGFNEGKAYETEYRIETPQGSRDIREIGQPIFADNGRHLRFIATAQDITEAKRRETELTRAKLRLEAQADALRGSEAKLRYVIDGSIQGILVMREDGKPVFANQAYATMMGFASPEEVLARANLRGLVDEESAASAAAFWHNLMAGRGDTNTRRQSKLALHDGRTVWVSTIGRKIDWDGAPAALLTVMDVTEQTIAEQELQKKTVELQELNQQKDKLFSIIAHDLRSPFNSVIGFADLLAAKARELSPGKVASYAQLVRESATGVHELLDNLLTWASYQIRDGALKLETLDLENVAASGLEPLVHMAEAKGVTIANNIGQTRVVGDEALVRIVIRNLVSNGIKFSRHGGIVQITTAPVVDAKQPTPRVPTPRVPMVRVTVRDDGVGIAAAAAERLFELGRTVSSPGTRGEKGTGLGLYLCRDIIGRHGGSIAVESEAGAGAAFHFTLPAAP